MKWTNWKCPKCGKISKYETICGDIKCGYSKPFILWLLHYKNLMLYPFLFSTGCLVYFIYLLANPM